MLDKGQCSRAIVVTGASSGIGKEIALTLLETGVSVIGVHNKTPPEAALPIDWINADIADAAALADRIEFLLRQKKYSLVGLIHCAAIYGAKSRHPFKETTESEWRGLIEINLTGQFIITQRLLPHLLSSEKAFVLAISSDVATMPGPGRIAYSVSKAGSFALFRGLAAEMEGTTVSVIQIRPKRQVWTPGIAKRRPANFDVSQYESPSIFSKPIVEIVICCGLGLNGALIEV